MVRNVLVLQAPAKVQKQPVRPAECRNSGNTAIPPGATCRFIPVIQSDAVELKQRSASSVPFSPRVGGGFGGGSGGNDGNGVGVRVRPMAAGATVIRGAC
jgi:hypothetical protein